MVLFNYSTKELTAKVVYYGPGLCGKTTNLQWIHEKLPIKNKGKMLSLATETDRTLFFDFLPIEIGTIRGMKTRIQLYTVPGQVFYNATRRMVLKGADAVVFVCDSQEAMLEANLESFENMRQNLEANEIEADEIPLVFQYNKRDLPNALPIEILNERLNPRERPWQEAVAPKGVGVEGTLKAVTKLVFKSLSARYGDGAGTGSLRAAQPPRETSMSGLVPSAPPLAPAPKAPPVSLPPIELEDTPPPQPARPAPPARPVPLRPASAPAVREAPRAASAFASAASRVGGEVPTRPPVAPTPPPRMPLGAHPPQDTLVARSDEADDLRRRIAAPGIPEDAELELEELEPDGTAPGEPRGSRPAAVSRPPTPPRPATRPPVLELDPEPEFATEAELAPDSLDPEREAEVSEVEVPIDIEVAPGTTRLTLNLRLVLSFKRR